ncbi:MAG: transposase [Pseudomonadota bacterium]
MTANAAGDEESYDLRLQFDRAVKLAFHGSAISSDGGLLLHRELDDALGLTDMAASLVADPRTGRNGRHRLIGFLRQTVFSRLSGYEDVNDADRLRLDPVMRQVVGGRAVKHGAASASAMGRFETEMLTQPKNLTALADLPGCWIDAVHDRQPPKSNTLDMDSSESPVHGDQEGSAWNGHVQSKCLHPLFLFNQYGDLERCSLRPDMGHSADGWEDVLKPVLARYAVDARPSITRRRFRALAYNLANFMRTLATRAAIKTWSLTSLRERLIKTGVRLVRHACYAVFQFAEAALPQSVFADHLGLINGLRGQPAKAAFA